MLNIFSVSFTVVMIIYPIFSKLGLFVPINDTIVFQILAICLLVALSQTLSLMITVNSTFLYYFVQFVDVYIVIMILGAGIFKIFPISLRGFIIPAIFAVIVFVLVGLFEYISAYKKVQEINQIIKNRQ